MSAPAAPLAPVIAIDGPSASGKGTVAARVAAALGFHYLDSGALYRLTALACRRAALALPADGAALQARQAEIARQAATLDCRFAGQQVWLQGEDVSLALREERTSREASQVAALGPVRAALLQRQRDFRQWPGLVTDGRDMGSVVFPDATLKVFLTASVEERARRRHKQLSDNGLPVSMEDLLRDLRERDQRDATRAYAPLVQEGRTDVLDTTCLEIEAAVAEVLQRYRAVTGPCA